MIRIATATRTAIRNAAALAARARRPLLALLLAGIASGVFLGSAGPASADVSASYGAQATETVTCDSSTHTVTVTFDAYGQDSGQIGGSDLFPYEIVEPVWVKVWAFQNGQWASSNWHQIANRGVASITENANGISYWYFQYAFGTANGTFEYRGEYAAGAGSYGLYADQYGYTTNTRCVS